MKRTAGIIILLAAVLLLGMAPGAAAGSPRLQGEPTVTGTPAGPVVMVFERANVRSGPGVDYDQVGVLIFGQTAPAVGRSPAGEWIQIVYPGAPGDRGWVFTPLVRLEPSSATLPIVELPPTPTPRVTATIDPTLAAQFLSLEAVPTRLPTYTPAAPLPQVTYEPEAVRSGGFPPILAIMALLVAGVSGGLISLLRGR